MPPHTNYTNAKYEDCLNALSEVIKQKPTNSILYIGGDFNCHLGIKTDDDESHVLGRKGITKTNDRGELLYDFLLNHNLCSLTSFFTKKDYGTWRPPGQTKYNQIDYTITSQSTQHLFQDSGTTINGVISDHTAIKSTLHQR